MATLIIACPICMQKMRAPDNVLGRQVKCPQCKNGFTAVDPTAVAENPLAFAPSRPRESVPPSETNPPTVDPLGLEEGDVPPAGCAGGSVMDYLLFRRMLTPVILTALFYIGVAVILLSGLAGGISSLAGSVRAGSTGLGLLALVLAFLGTLAAVVLWRVFCEVVITLFRIFEQLREMNERQRGA